MSRSVSPSSDKPYGLSRVCRIWGASLEYGWHVPAVKWVTSRNS